MDVLVCICTNDECGLLFNIPGTFHSGFNHSVSHIVVPHFKICNSLMTYCVDLFHVCLSSLGRCLLRIYAPLNHVVQMAT